MNWTILLWIAGLLLVIGGYFWLMRWYQRKRAAEYQQYASARGYQFQAERPGAEARYERVVKLFREGHGHHWRDEISGQMDGRPFSAFEYTYTTGSGRYSHTYHCAMMQWSAPNRDFPRFALAPEGFFDRVGQVFGVQDIDFGEDPTFSKSYVLKGSDPAAVQALFTAQVREALVARPGQHIAGAGQDLFWWRESSLPDPDKIDDFLADGDSASKLFISD